MKKIILLIGFLSSLCLSGCQINDDLKGEGSEESPYLIQSTNDLLKFSSYINQGKEKYMNAHVKLTNDLNMKNTSMKPIGGLDFHYFNGTFDGDNHSISNFKPHENYKMQGLFGENDKDCVIKNLNLSLNITVKHSTAFVGGIIAHNTYGGLVENCHVTGSINFKTLHPSPISTNAELVDKYSKEKEVYEHEEEEPKTVTKYYSKNKAGGIVGCNYGTIKDCTSSISITADVVGGIAGTNAGKIINCESSDSNLYSTSATGGIVGFSNFVSHLKGVCEVTNCSSKNHTLLGENYIGGVVGAASGHLDVTHCQAYGIIKDTKQESTVIGGIVGGCVYQIGTITSSTSNLSYWYLNMSLNVVSLQDCLSFNSIHLEDIKEQKSLLYFPMKASSTMSTTKFTNIIEQANIVKEESTSVKGSFNQERTNLYLIDNMEIKNIEGNKDLSELNKNIIQESFNADLDNIVEIQVDDVTGFVFKTMNF